MPIPESSPIRAFIQMPFLHHRGLFDVLFHVPVIRSLWPFQCAVSGACYSFIEAFSMCCLKRVICSFIEAFSKVPFIYSLRPFQCAFRVPFIHHRGLFNVLFRVPVIRSSRPFRCAVRALLPRSFCLYPLFTARVFSGVPFAHRYFVFVHLFK